jgi:hypothetical protein
MIPTVTQQLQSMRLRLMETIIPALPSDARFAREQAGLMVATLDWLLDTHEYQYRYEVVENVEYRRLLAELTGSYGDMITDEATRRGVHEALAAPGPSVRDAATPLRDLTDQNRRLKWLTQRVFTTLSEAPSGDTTRRARTLLAQVARRQARRELAFFRLTGFPQETDDLQAVLAGAAEELED